MMIGRSDEVAAEQRATVSAIHADARELLANMPRQNDRCGVEDFLRSSEAAQAAAISPSGGFMAPVMIATASDMV